MFGIKKARNAIRRIRDLATAASHTYEGTVALEEEGYGWRIPSTTAKPATKPKITVTTVPAVAAVWNTSDAWETRQIPRLAMEKIPMPTPLYQRRQVPIGPGVRGYYSIARAETVEDAVRQAALGMKFDNIAAVLAGLDQWVKDHPAEPVAHPEPADIGTLLLRDWGALKMPHITALFDEKETVAA